jgi:hypothetical protein
VTTSESRIRPPWNEGAPLTPGTTPSVLERRLRFEQRRPEIVISPPFSTQSGRWEVREPGQEPRTYSRDAGEAMMRDLEREYPA